MSAGDALSREERALINRHAHWLAGLAYEAFKIRLAERAASIRKMQGREMRADDILGHVPDINELLRLGDELLD